MTSLKHTKLVKSDSVVTNSIVPLKDTMGVWNSFSRTPTPPPPVVEVEIRSTAGSFQPRGKSYHMGWAQVVEELSWKFNNPNSVSVC